MPSNHTSLPRVILTLTNCCCGSKRKNQLGSSAAFETFPSPLEAHVAELEVDHWKGVIMLKIRYWQSGLE